MPCTDVIAFARSLADIGADPTDSATRARYLDLVAPNEIEARAAEMAQMSGCALTMRGILRHFIQHPILAAPYRDRQAMSDLVTIASAAGAAFTSRRSPMPGDIVIVGGGTDGGGPEHTWMALDVCSDPYAPVSYPNELVTAIDGGQRDDGDHQVIRVRDHEVQGEWDSTSTYRRRIRWVLDTAKVIERFGR